MTLSFARDLRLCRWEGGKGTVIPDPAAARRIALKEAETQALLRACEDAARAFAGKYLYDGGMQTQYAAGMRADEASVWVWPYEGGRREAVSVLRYVRRPNARERYGMHLMVDVQSMRVVQVRTQVLLGEAFYAENPPALLINAYAAENGRGRENESARRAQRDEREGL